MLPFQTLSFGLWHIVPNPCFITVDHSLEKIMLLLLVTRPLPRDGGMSRDHGAPEAGQLPRVWTRGRRETESRQRVRSWTVQNEMRGVLGRVSTGAAGRILDSANTREIAT